MSHRQAQLASTSDGFIGGAFIVVGFVVLVVVAVVDLVSSRWSPSDPTTQVKEESKQTSASVAPLQETDSSAADFDKSSPEEPIPLSDTETLENTQSSSVLPESAEQFPDTQFDFSPPQDLDNKDVDKVEESTTEVSLVQNQDLKQVEPIAEHQIAEPIDSSQEWVSLSQSDESLSPLIASDAHLEDLTFSIVPPEQETPQAETSLSSQQELTLETPTPIDLPLHHDSAMPTNLSTSLPSLPEPDDHTFDTEVGLQTNTERQMFLNPNSSNNAESVFVELKGRTSTPSLKSTSGSINRDLPKKKRGGSFIKKPRTLMKKVFKSKDDMSTNVNDDPNIISTDNVNLPLSSSLYSEVENPGLEAPRKLTSPSRVSLQGSIRSISGSIKKKIGKSSTNTTGSGEKDVFAIAQDQLEAYRQVTLLPSNPNAQPPSNGVDTNTGSEPSLLKSMFKIRRSSK